MDELVQALMNEQKRYQQQNLFNSGGDLLNSYSQQMMQGQGANNNGNLTASIIAGLAGGLSKGYAQKQNRDFAQELAQSLRGTSKAFYETGDASGFYNSPYQSVQEIAPLMQFKMDASNFDQRQKMALENQKRSLDFKYQQADKGRVPVMGEDGGLLIQPMAGYGETEAALERPKKLLDLQYNLELEKAKQGMAVNSPNAKWKWFSKMMSHAVQGNEDKLRTELYTRGGVEALRTIDQAYNSMLGNLNNPAGASDLDFVYGTAKALDPNSVVREGEQVQMTRTDGIFGTLNSYLGQVKGQQKLAPETRRSLLDLVGSRRDEALKTFNQTLGDIGTVAGNRNASMENINIYGNYKPSSELYNPVPYSPEYMNGQAPRQQPTAQSSPQVAEPTVSIRSKSTGQMMKIPVSQLSNYGLR